MTGDKLQRVKSVKKWLERAENSYQSHEEFTGEINLIMAQAEMQRLKEVNVSSPYRKWILRMGTLLVALAVIGGINFFKDLINPTHTTEQTVSSTEVAAKPVEDTEHPEIEKRKETLQSVNASVETQTVSGENIGKVEKTIIEKPTKEVIRPAAVPALSDKEIQSVVGEAGRALRGQV